MDNKSNTNINRISFEKFKEVHKNKHFFKFNDFIDVYGSSTNPKKITFKIYSELELNDLSNTIKLIEYYWHYLMSTYIAENGDPFLFDCTVGNGFVVWTKFNKERNVRQRYIMSPIGVTQSGRIHEMFINQIKDALKSEGIDAQYNYGRLD